jgi:hypothetical protein
MKQCARNGDVIKRDIPRHNNCGLKGMIEKRSARCTEVISVSVDAKIKGTPNQVFVNLWKIFPAGQKEIVQLFLVLCACHVVPFIKQSPGPSLASPSGC